MPNRAQYLVGWSDQRCAWGIGPSDDYVEGDCDDDDKEWCPRLTRGSPWAMMMMMTMMMTIMMTKNGALV